MRRRIIILGTVLVLVFVAWTVGWFVVANELRKNIVALADADGVTNPKVTCANLGIGGYPFRMDVTCTEATLVDQDETVDLAELRATVQVDNPFHLLVFAKGPANLADAFTGSRSRIDWQSLEASIRLTDWRIARLSVVAEQPAWTDTLAGETPIANAAHLEFHVVDVPELLDKAAHTAALGAYVTVTGLVAPAQGIDQGQGTLEAQISGLPDDVRAFGDPQPLQRWQAAGGQLKVTTLKGNDSDQSFDVTGTMSLDSAGRPDGQVSITSHGIVEQISSLVPDQLRGLMLGSPAADGSYAEVLTLHSGVIFSGIVPAGMLPALW